MSLILAGVGLIESLLTLNLIDELTETRGRGNKECIGQGVANSVNGLFGGMGGCAMIGQSIININSGGRGRLSGIVAALALLAFILFAAGLIEMIPVAALIGVMFMVVLGTFEWATFRMLGKVPLADTLISVILPGGLLYASYRKLSNERAQAQLASVNNELSELSKGLLLLKAESGETAVALLR